MRLPIPLPRSGDAARATYVPLGEIATLDMTPGPNQVSRENGKRRVVVSANVTGRDLGSFVAEAQRAVDAVPVPSGYWTAWGGTFEQLQSASQRLRIVVPLALALVLILLFTMFGNLKDGLLVFTGIPFRADRRHPRAVAARPPAVDLRRGGLHRAVRRGGASTAW